jgi:uncharacterized repeat protein (TIGR01451 family)
LTSLFRWLPIHRPAIRSFRRTAYRLVVEQLEAREVPASISGRVFEDVNYGGGAGRSLADSAGILRPGVRVELYDAAGVFVEAAPSDAAGNYMFSVLDNAAYSVRVVNSTVTSSRPVGVAGLIPAAVQTFRSDASSGTPAAVTGEVGGAVPSAQDGGAKGPGDNLSDAAIEQSIAQVAVGIAPVAGLDFGFNFDTIVNTNDTGQGSLRQFILNSSALAGETALVQKGLPAGFETSVFMVPQSSLTSGVAAIDIVSSLPKIEGARTRIDGSTQTDNIGDTNPGTLGTGGAVGVDDLPLSTIPRPEVAIRHTNQSAAGLNIEADDVTIRGVSIHGFAGESFADIRVGNHAGALIEQNVIGAGASSFSSPPDTERSTRYGILLEQADDGIIRDNLIGFTGRTGILFWSAAMGWLVEGNEIRDTSWAVANNDGISIELKSGGVTVRGNLLAGALGHGIDTWMSDGSNTIVNNTVHGNGIGGYETSGIHLQGIGNQVSRNLIFANYGAGIGVWINSSWDLITQNSIYGNGTITGRNGQPPSGQIGIDLLTPANSMGAGTAPFITPNDVGDSDSGGNGLVNTPVLDQARATGGRLRLTGWARPGAVVEFFLADPDATNFGEGKTYLITLVEGSADDQSADISSYGPSVNGLDVGTDFTNRFTFDVPLASLSAAVADGTVLTATATVGNATSEFSGNVIVNPAPIDLVVTQRFKKRNALVRTVVVFVVTVTNRGPATARDVLVREVFQKGLKPISAQPTQGTFNLAQSSWNVGALPPGAVAKLTIRVRVTSAGRKTVRATATAPLLPDLTPADNFAVARLTALAAR